MAKRLFTLSSGHFIFLISFYFAFVLNNAFWDCIEQRLDMSNAATAVFAFSLPFFVFIMLYVFFNLIVVPYLGKPLVCPPRAMLPMPPPKRTASAQTTPFSLLSLLNTTMP